MSKVSPTAPSQPGSQRAMAFILFGVLGAAGAAILVVMSGGPRNELPPARHHSAQSSVARRDEVKAPETRVDVIRPSESHPVEPRRPEPRQPVVAEQVKTVVIQYTGEDNYRNDHLPGTVTPGPVQDTLLLVGAPTDDGMRNYDDMQIALNYRHSKGGTISALIRFELPALKSESVVKASLELYGWNDSGTAGMRIAAYPLLKSWNQTSNGACFDRREDRTPWNPGATPSSFNFDPETTTDFDSQRGVVFLGARRDQWQRFDITPIVKSWLDGSLGNSGVAIMSLTPNAIVRCRSSNYLDESAPDKGVGFRPKLVIQHK